MARPNIGLDLMLGDDHYWWNSLKVLTRSDVNGSSRLLWPREMVERQVLDGMDDENLAARCRSGVGAPFEVVDSITGTIYWLVLKKWVTNSFVFTGNWMRDFVNRLRLEEGDVIGLIWDGSKFYFSLRHRGNLV